MTAHHSLNYRQIVQCFTPSLPNNNERQSTTVPLPEKEEELQCTKNAEQWNVQYEVFDVEQTHSNHILAITCNAVQCNLYYNFVKSLNAFIYLKSHTYFYSSQNQIKQNKPSPFYTGRIHSGKCKASVWCFQEEVMLPQSSLMWAI